MALLRTEAALCLGQLGSLQPSCLPFVPLWQRNGPAPFDGGDVGDFDEGCDDYCDDFGELDDRHHVVDVAASGEGMEEEKCEARWLLVYAGKAMGRGATSPGKHM